MNYSKVNWSNQSAITKDSLDKMDSGIAALAEDVNEMHSSVTALSLSNIQRGAYHFVNGELPVQETGGKKYMKAQILFAVEFQELPTVILQIKSGRVTEGYATTVGVTKTGAVEILLYLPSGQVSDEGIWVQWVAIGA